MTFYPEYYIMTKMFLRNGGRLFDNGCASYFEALRAAERICGFVRRAFGSGGFCFAITRGEGNTEGNNEGDNEGDIEGDIGLGIKRNQIRSRT